MTKKLEGLLRLVLLKFSGHASYNESTGDSKSRLAAAI